MLYERMLQYCCCFEGGDCCCMNERYNIVVVVKVATAVRGGVSICEQRSSSRSRRGGVSKNWTEGATAARLFFLTAVAIAIATRPFKYHEISVSTPTSSFVFSIHSFDPLFLEKWQFVIFFVESCGLSWLSAGSR